MIRNELATLIPWQLAPFWVDTRVTSGTVLIYVLAVATIGAVIVGVIPALQATGRRAQSGLQHAAASSSGWRIGRTYGILIVLQVTLAVAILPYAASTAWTSLQEAIADPGFPADQFLTARIDVERDLPSSMDGDPALSARTSPAAWQMELRNRLEAEPSVADIIFLSAAPGSEPRAAIEVEAEVSREVRTADVAMNFFDSFNIPVLAGRQFATRDLELASRHVVVNRAFAQDVVHGNPIGRRVRQTSLGDSTPGPWLEIVGVVEDFPIKPAKAYRSRAALYRPLPDGDPRLGLLALRIRGGTPAAAASRLREITTALNRHLLLQDIRSMDALLRDQQMETRVGAWMSGAATLSLLLLSATGLYALMAFAVTQRRREIGIRVALGADARAVVGSILSRALWQLGAGIVFGVAIAALLAMGTAGESTGGTGLRMLPAVAGFVLCIGLLAAAVPARRGLHIEPTDALREP